MELVIQIIIGILIAKLAWYFATVMIAGNDKDTEDLLTEILKELKKINKT